MTISELIRELDLVKAREGNIDVCIFDAESSAYPITDFILDSDEIKIAEPEHILGAPWTDNRRIVIGVPPS